MSISWVTPEQDALIQWMHEKYKIHWIVASGTRVKYSRKFETSAGIYYLIFRIQKAEIEIIQRKKKRHSVKCDVLQNIYGCRNMVVAPC